MKANSLYLFEDSKVYVSSIVEYYDEYSSDDNNDGEVHVMAYYEWDEYGPLGGSGIEIPLERFSNRADLIEEDFDDLFINPSTE
jgi:hypothetical protein